MIYNLYDLIGIFNCTDDNLNDCESGVTRLEMISNRSLSIFLDNCAKQMVHFIKNYQLFMYSPGIYWYNEEFYFQEYSSSQLVSTG